MAPLNYRHLRCFHAVAHEGGVTAAAKALHVSQPSVSALLQKLEASIGHRLFDRRGRSMVLTPEGRVVLEYADEIFRLERELESAIRGQIQGRPMRLAVGLTGTIPNLVTLHLLEPVFGLDHPVRLIVREDRSDRLLADLATHDLDLVLADVPVPAHVGVRAFNHPLGASPVDIFGPPAIARRAAKDFPASLDGQPFLLPAEGYALRRSLDEWFAGHGIHPHVVGEVEDIDLVNVLAEAGNGMFAAPAIIAADIQDRYDVDLVGRADGLEERFFAITAHRRLQHPGVQAISEAARAELKKTV